MLQKWDESKGGMPEVAGADFDDDSNDEAASKRGIGSYAAKLKAAKQRGLGSDPDQVWNIFS